jgi:hypothetical protein
LAFFLSIGIDRSLGPFNTKAAESKSTAVLLLEATVHIWLLGVLGYAVRNIVELIPFPLDGVAGYDHSRLGELKNAALFSVTVLVFQKNLAARLQYLYSRMVRF